MKIRHKLICLLSLLASVVGNAQTGVGERTFEVINAANGLADNSAQTIVCTLTGRMIITTVGDVNFYDGTQFSHVRTDKRTAYQLENYRGNYHLYFDKRHHLWLKNTYSVTCVDLLTEWFVSDIDAIFREMGVDSHVDDLFVDEDGHVWLMVGQDIYSVDERKTYRLMGTENLQDLMVNGNQLLLFYGNGELQTYDMESGKELGHSMAYGDSESAEFSSSSVLLRDSSTVYQIRNGSQTAILLKYNLDTREWATILKVPYHLNNISQNGDRLYMASEYGYWYYDKQTGEATHVPTVRLFDGREWTTDINSLAFDRQGGMWIGTEKRGVLYSRPLKAPFRALSWSNPKALKYAVMMDDIDNTITDVNGKEANCMAIDSRHWSWFGTADGLYLFKSPQSEPVVLGRRDGLLNGVIHSIIEDDFHNMWVSTSYGVSVVVIDHDQIAYVNSFNNHDGVPNEMFINSRAMKLADGTIVMQALDHVLEFNPADFQEVNTPHNVELYPKLIRLMVNGSQVDTGQEVDGHVILPRASTRIKTIALNFDQNSVSLTFSALNYARPMQTYYRVRVVGLDDTWKVFSYFNSDGMVDGRGLLHLPLVGLRPGVYKIEVQASMYPNVWENRPYEWVVEVNEPWWRTTGMFIALGVVLLALLVLNFFLYNRNTRMRIRRNSEEGDVVKRIRNYVERCDSLSNDILTPYEEDVYGGEGESGRLSPEFVDMMLKVVPYVHEQDAKNITMRKLCGVAGMDIEKMYDVVSANLYKSPRMMVHIFRLERAAEMLRTSDRSIEAISVECGFVSPNFFIANFYHRYKLTPKEYREREA